MKTRMLVLAVAALGSTALGQTTRQDKEVSSLVQSLGSEDWRVRRDAASSLRRLGVKAASAIPALAARTTKDDDVNVRQAAILALVEVGRDDPRQLVPTLILALEDDFCAIRVDAVDALRNIGPAAKQAVPAPIRMMDAPPHGASSPDFVGALDKIGVDAATLVRLMNGKAERAGRYAVSSMAKLGGKAVPELAGLIKSGSAIGQARAAKAIAEIGPAAKDAAPVLAAALSSPEARVRGAAVRAIGQIGPAAKQTTPKLLNLLNSDRSAAVRAAAAKALAAVAPPRANTVSSLAVRLSDADASVRMAAASALGQYGPDAKSAAAALVRALEDEDWDVRACAFEALGKVGRAAKAAVPEMLKVIRTPFAHKEYGFTAVEAYSLSAEEAASMATRDARQNAVTALGKIAPDSKEVFAAVRKAAGSGDMDVKPQALEALACFGKLTREGAVEVLFKALTDKGKYRDTLTQTALGTLEKVGTSDPETIRFILKMPPRGAVGVGVMEKLGPDDKALVPDLVAALKWQDPNVPPASRHVPLAAIAGLTAIGRPGFADLLKVFEGGNGVIAGYAAEVIAEMGAGAKPALPALVKALGDKDRWKAGCAARALRRIGPEANEAMPALLDMIRQRKPGRTMALGVVGALKPDARTVLPVLVGIARDARETAADRLQAVVSLARMGPDAKGALPTLRELAGDDKLGRYASAAIKHIEGKKSK